MDRRALLVGSLGLLAAPSGADAQTPAKVYRIGLLGGTPPSSPEGAHLWEAFFRELRDLGYVEGQNVVMEGRWYGDHPERLPVLATELVQLPVDVIVAGASPSPEAARRVTSSIPIVMASHPDPIGSRLVASLARPGGNVTGLSVVSPETRPKQLQLLKEVLPRLSRVAILSNPTIPSQALDVREVEVAARSLKLRVQRVEARDPSEFATAFSAATREQPGALVVLAGSVFYNHRLRLVELVAENRLPAIYGQREFAQVGGLLTYGADIRDNWRRSAGYVARILKGARPADLPVEQPTKFELVINLKTAKALGLTIPQSVLARADEVIQ